LLADIINTESPLPVQERKLLEKKIFSDLEIELTATYFCVPLVAAQCAQAPESGKRLAGPQYVIDIKQINLKFWPKKYLTIRFFRAKCGL
jgi:hypothetical protein